MRSVLLALALLGGCKSVEEEVTLYFPSQGALDATNVIAFTAFEPIIVRPDSEVPEFVGCDRVGVFPPTRILDPDTIATFPNLGEVLRERESQTFPFDGGWNVEVPEIEADDPNNPWGAVLVYLEARGEVRAPDEQGGGQISATLLAGCYCVRTLEGGHADRRLDAEVKAACPMLGGDDGSERQRTIDLKPVVTPEFKLAACTVQDLTSPKNQVVSPGPAVCVETVRCDDAPLATECFKCQQPCDELNDMRNVPVMFSIDQPGGASEPKTQVVLTNAAGLARGQLAVDGCDTAVAVDAQVVGRAGDPVRFEVQCVDPVSQFTCGNEKRLMSGIEPQKMALLPNSNGRDFVAILYDDGQSAYLSLVNPTVPGTEEEVIKQYNGETPRAVHGFFYDLANRSRPVLAVVTSAADLLKLYLYEWDGTTLVEHDGTSTGVIAEDCNTWFCGSLQACNPNSCTDAEESCSLFDLCTAATPTCKLKVEFQTEVSLSHRDIDGDGLADLAIATNSDLPLTTYFSKRNTGPGVFSAQGCACGLFAQAPSTFELINFGGADTGSIDLVIGAPGGAFVKYAQELDAGSALSCGQPCRFGDLVPVRDVARGHFQCNPSIDLCPFDDVVVVAAKSLGGGSFDDPGTIRVIYGEPSDLCLVEDLFASVGSNVELIPRKLENQSDPRDPRTAEVGDFNADGNDDLAVLFGSSEEVHVWLGASNKGLGEVEKGIVLANCELAVQPATEKCNPLRDFALPDFDDDGKSDVAVVCKQGGDNRLRWYTPGAE